MTNAVVILGENLVDIFIDADGRLTPIPGGGPFTVARTVARLGQHAYFFSGLSTDTFGVQLREVLRADGVVTAFERASDKPTSLALVRANGGAAHYAFYLSDTAAFENDATATLDRYGRLAVPSALYVGTLGLIVEPMAEAATALVSAVDPTTLVVVDPNCRPAATGDHDRYRARLLDLFRRADVVKVSTDDLSFIAPHRETLDAARDIAARGPRWIIITDGPHPVRLMGPHGISTFPVDDRPIVDTVGAGDTLVGGFLAWWTGHDFDRRAIEDLAAVTEAVAAGIEIASITCERRGAEPPVMAELGDVAAWAWLRPTNKSQPSP